MIYSKENKEEKQVKGQKKIDMDLIIVYKLYNKILKINNYPTQFSAVECNLEKSLKAFSL